MAVSTIATFAALSPPNPSIGPTPKTGDSCQILAKKSVRIFILAPLALLTLHTCVLAYFYPTIPSMIYGYGRWNRLNVGLVTWSMATSIPLSCVLCLGVPLRLVSYSLLGKNFTFALAEPDRLVTGGIYRHLQHPSYVGSTVLVICNMMLLCRIDGVLSCWIPPQWYRTAQLTWWILVPFGGVLLIFGTRRRVMQEESMMQAKFGVKWEQWHTKTARFIPYIF